MSQLDFWALDLRLLELAAVTAARAAARAEVEQERGAEQFEHLRRSLGQKFRRLREEEIDALREWERRRKSPLTSSFMVKLWARKLFEQAMRPTIFERFQ